MTTLEVNTSKKNLFTELFSKENRLLLHKHIINKLKLSDISKESKKNILNILQKNMKSNYDKLKIDSNANPKMIIQKFNNDSIEKTLNELVFLRSLMNNFNNQSFEQEPGEIIMNKLFSDENIAELYDEIINILNLNEKSKNVKEKALEILKKKMQVISSKLQPNMINKENFESILNQFNKMSIKETVDQISNQKNGIIEPNSSKLKFERDFNSMPNKGNKLMDRPLATNKNQENFLYPPGFERESKNNIPDPRFDKLFKPIVENMNDNYQFNNYQSSRNTGEMGNSFEKLMSEREIESSIAKRPSTPDFLKPVPTNIKAGSEDFKQNNSRSLPESKRKGGKPNFSQSIPEDELDTGFLSANDNNDLYDINNIDKPVESLEFEEDHRSFEQRLKSLERDRGNVSTELVLINNEVDTMQNLQPKTIEELRKEKEEKDYQREEMIREEREKIRREIYEKDHLKYLSRNEDDSEESPKPKVNMQKVQDALKKLGISKKVDTTDLDNLKKENKLLKKQLGFDFVKKEIGTEFTKLNEKEIEIRKKEEEMKVLLKKYSYVYGLKHVLMDISPQTSTSKYVFNFNKISNINGIRMMSYSIPVPRYNIEEDKNNIFKIKCEDEIIEIKLNSGKYKIDDVLNLLTKKSNFTFELNYEEKVEIKSDTKFDIIQTPLSKEVLGFTEEYINNESYVADKTWDLRIEDKIYLFINNIEENIPFGVLYIGNQAVQQFKFDEPIELDNLDIEFKDSKGRPYNFYGLNYSISVQLELSEPIETSF